MRNKSIILRLVTWPAEAIISLVLVLTMLSSCKDIIEPDISKSQVSLLAPAPNSRSTAIVQSFQWSPVPDARTYRLQLATPSFTNPTRVLLDTVIRQTSLKRTLTPRSYEWRVQALNAGYATAFAGRSLVIDSTNSLNGQSIQLLLPAPGFATNAANVTLTWARLPMARQYRIYVSPNPRASSLAPLDSTIGASTTVTLRLARQSQTYQWRITASNTNSQVVSASQSFEVDLTPPTAPTLTSPAASASFLALPITLSWSRTSPDVVRDSVFIYRADQTTRVIGFPQVTSGTNFIVAPSMIMLNSGSYFWAIRSVDRVGNPGVFSVKRPFFIQ